MPIKHNANPGAEKRLMQSRISAGFRSASAAAKHFGWLLPTYGQHEAGSRTISPERARIYGDAFKIDWKWLLTGLHDAGVDEVVSSMQSSRLGSGPSRTLDVFNTSGQVISSRAVPNILSQSHDAYAVLVSDSSMVERFLPREIVYVDPQMPCRVGDYVVIRRHGLMRPVKLVSMESGVINVASIDGSFTATVRSGDEVSVHVIVMIQMA